MKQRKYGLARLTDDPRDDAENHLTAESPRSRRRRLEDQRDQPQPERGPKVTTTKTSKTRGA